MVDKCMHMHLPSGKGPTQIIKMMTFKANPGIAQQMAHEIIMKRVGVKVVHAYVKMMMKYVQVNFKIGGATQQMKYKNDKF